jgi:hypothetical protein
VVVSRTTAPPSIAAPSRPHTRGVSRTRSRRCSARGHRPHACAPLTRGWQELLRALTGIDLGVRAGSGRSAVARRPRPARGWLQRALSEFPADLKRFELQWAQTVLRKS